MYTSLSWWVSGSTSWGPKSICLAWYAAMCEGTKGLGISENTGNAPVLRTERLCLPTNSYVEVLTPHHGCIWKYDRVSVLVGTGTRGLAYTLSARRQLFASQEDSPRQKLNLPTPDVRLLAPPNCETINGCCLRPSGCSILL